MARILIVDDEASLLTLVSRMVELAGHEAVTCRDGAEAIRRIRDEHFDLVVSDVRMSPVDGVQVLAAARQGKPELPVIMVSAYSDDDVRQRIDDLGAAAFVAKPFRMSDLIGVVTRCLDGRPA